MLKDILEILYSPEMRNKIAWFEKERKKCAFKVRLFNYIAIISLVLAIIFMSGVFLPALENFHFSYNLPVPQMLNYNTNGFIIYALCISFLSMILMLFLTPVPYIFLAALFALAASIHKHRFVKEVKKEILSDIFKSFIDKLYYNPGRMKFIPIYLTAIVPIFSFIQEGINLFLYARNISNLPENAVRNFEIIPNNYFLYPDDTIGGIYNNHEIVITEIELYNLHRSRRSSAKIGAAIAGFRGVIYQTKSKGTISAQIYIENKHIGLKLNRTNLAKVDITSSVFNRLYNVYSDNQDAARSFLTSAKMKELVGLYNKGQVIHLFCTNQDTTIVKKAAKDSFEPDIYKPMNDPASYYEILTDTKEMLDFITNFQA